MQWYLAVLKKYAVFEGRARRKELWMFYLISTEGLADSRTTPTLSDRRSAPLVGLGAVGFSSGMGYSESPSAKE